MDGERSQQPTGGPAAGARLAALSDAATALVGLSFPSMGPSEASSVIAGRRKPGDSREAEGEGRIYGKKRPYHHHQTNAPGEWSKRHEGQRGGPKSRTTSLDSTTSHAFSVGSSCEQSQHASDDEQEYSWGGAGHYSHSKVSAPGAMAMPPPPSAWHRGMPPPHAPPRHQTSAMPLAPDGSYAMEDELEPGVWHDAQLLTAIAVLLAACGVNHSVRATHTEAKWDGVDKGDPGDLGGASPRAEASFRASVRRVLQREVAPLAPLGRVDFARLCQLLDLPLQVGAEWQGRAMKLQAQLQPHGQWPTAPMAGEEGSGECAANVMSAFCAALASERSREREGRQPEPERAKLRHFGRQTVWCTVSLLRKVLCEASWPEGGRKLSSAKAEAKLASLAVAAIGGNCSTIAREASGNAAPAMACEGAAGEASLL